MTHSPDAVAAHYTSRFLRESGRLINESPAEYAITARLIAAHIPSGSTVADIGVGGGLYAEALARNECDLVLVDICGPLLKHASHKLLQAGFGGRIRQECIRSAVDLEPIESGTCDAVLLLGPLYHLATAQERGAAVREATRILRRRGLLLAAGINRLAYFRDLLREAPLCVAERRAFHQRFLIDGNLTPEEAPNIGFAHLTTVDGFRSLFRADYDEIALVGVESFSAAWQKDLLSMPDADRQAWLDLVAQTGEMPEGLAAADHFLFIGRKHSETTA